MGQIIGALVMGTLFGLIVLSQGKKKNQAQLANIGLAACVGGTLISTVIGMYWILGAVIMVGFLVTINAQSA